MSQILMYNSLLSALKPRSNLLTNVPLCPHQCKLILFIFITQKTSILHERWPVAGEIDEVSIKASDYLMDAAHSFRIYLKNHCAVKKPKKGETPKPEKKPNKAVIWVAKQYPKWQHIILTTMKELNGPSGLPDNKVISSKLGAIPELKKYMKRVMPFVQATRDNMERIGIEALSVGLLFDEAAILLENKLYLLNTLDLDSIEVKYTDDPEAPEKTREDCAPGQPHVSFSVESGVDATFINPIAMNGLFTVIATLSDGDTVERVKVKIAKEVKAIKDLSSLKLWRYKDPVLGPRTIPVPGDHENRCVVLDNAAVLKVDLNTATVELVSNGKNLPVGTKMIYTYEK